MAAVRKAKQRYQVGREQKRASDRNGELVRPGLGADTKTGVPVRNSV